MKTHGTRPAMVLDTLAGGSYIPARLAPPARLQARHGMLFEMDIRPLALAAQGHARAPVLDGRLVASALLDEVQRATRALAARGIVPRLAVVRVGDDPASEIYVRHKVRAAAKVGIDSDVVALSASVSAEELDARLRALSDDTRMDGILLQLPLPQHLSPFDAILAIDPAKDVDGFHPANLGCLASGRAELEPCTPRGIMTLLEAAGVELAGKKAVVVGRSVIVGRPMAQMLVRADATVTTCHRYTEDLEGEVRRADIVVVATGVPALVPGHWIKPGATVVDVGINRVATGGLVGDVDFKGAVAHARWITPVPGGVGPMTVATLMENTVRAALLARGLCYRGGAVMDLAEAGGELATRLNLCMRHVREGR